MSLDQVEIVNQFKEEWSNGNSDAGEILTPLLNSGMVLDAETARLYDASQIGYARTEALNREKIKVQQAIKNKLHQKALDLVNSCLEKEPNYSYLLMLKGINYYQWGKKSEALEFLTKAVQLQPWNASACFNLACFYASQRDKESMMLCLMNAVKFGRENYATDYRENIKEETAFDPYRSDSDFIEAFVSPYDNEVLDSLMFIVSNDKVSKYHSLISEIEDNLETIKEQENFINEPGYLITQEMIDEGEVNRYQLLEILTYVYEIIVEDLRRNEEENLQKYLFCEEENLNAFQVSFLRSKKALLEISPLVYKRTALEIGLGSDTYNLFLERIRP